MRAIGVILLAFCFTFGADWRIRPASNGVTGLTVDLSGVAVAQERRRRRSLLRSLFGRREVRRSRVERRKARPRRATQRRKVRRKRTVRRKAKPRRQVRRARKAKRRTTRTPRRRRAAAAAAVAAAPAVVEKQEGARKVLVIGDFFADGLAWGLRNRLSDAENIVVVEKAKGASGFVRDDHYDWPERLPELVEAEKPDYIVFQIGSNDRQLLRTAGGGVKPREPEWDAAYKARIEEMAKALKETGKPFLWVGVPPVRFTGMNRDFLVFNEWYKAAAEAAGGSYTDVWDGFSDAEGKYSRSGPNEQGRIVTLRAKDGINLTKRGRTKLAYYAEAPVRKALSGAGSTFLTSLPAIDLGSPVISEQVYNPARTGRTVVVKLNDPSLYGTDALAGAEKPAEPSAPAPAAAAPAGRADNWAWSE